jgi:membrane protease YdiL (CAAX protease family)
MNQVPRSVMGILPVVAFYTIMGGTACAISWARRGELPIVLPDREMATVLTSAVIGLGAALVVHGASELLERIFEWARTLRANIQHMIGELSLGRAAIYATFSAVGEELLFRGLLLPELGLVVSSVLFGALHIGPDRSYLPWTIMATLTGFVFGGLTLYTGDVTAAVLAHLTVNYAGFVSMLGQKD